MTLGAIALGLLLVTPAPQGTGTIVGKVRIAQVPAALPPVKIAKDAPVCGKEAALDLVRVGADGGLADVVVSLKGIRPARPPAPTPNASIDQIGCRYTPHVQAVTVGTPLTLLNNDAVFHNVHGNLQQGEGQVTVFNVAMPVKGMKLPQVMKKPGAVKVRCDAGHTWMGAWVHVFDHPWFAVSDGDGKFVIGDVPPGEHVVVFSHEPVSGKGAPVTATATVKVTAGRAATADVVLPL